MRGLGSGGKREGAASVQVPRRAAARVATRRNRETAAGSQASVQGSWVLTCRLGWRMLSGRAP